MPDYPSRKAGTRNLVYGIILILLAIVGLISVTAENVSGSNLTGSTVVFFLFVFVGSYEIGKYSEHRIEDQNRHKADHKSES